MTLVTGISALTLLFAADPPLQQGGGMTMQDNGSTYAIEQGINRYLDVQEHKNIVTPGDFTEWPLQLRAGQVVIADARSEAFDPALEIANESNVSQAANDDRYPGDQRPLLLWRCPVDGKYLLRVRSFQNKAGGQAFIRFKVFNSIDVGEQAADHEFQDGGRYLLRLDLKKGEVKQLVFEFPNDRYARPGLGQVISPIGLPHLKLARALEHALPDSLIAPVEGSYYVIADIPGRNPIRMRARTLTPVRPSNSGLAQVVNGSKDNPVLVSFDVKAGQLIEIATPELGMDAFSALSEQPDFSKFDLQDPEKNPFFPQDRRPLPPSPFRPLPARSRDPRIGVYAVVRDATLWLACNGKGGTSKDYSVAIRNGAEALSAGAPKQGKLRIGKTDYWVFEANVGDVMKLRFQASGFSQRVIVRDPALREIYGAEALPDQDSIDWQMMATEPGRYLVAVSSVGDGGGGEYSLIRKVIPPREFGKGVQAAGSFEDGQTQVWKCTIKPGEPLYVHWRHMGADYETSIRDARGNPFGLNLTTVDDSNSFGIISVREPTALLIVLTPRSNRGSFAISLSDLPGYVRK